MENQFNQDKEFEARWMGTSDMNPIKAWEKRVAISRWSAQAWEEICMEMNFATIGFSTGCNMTLGNKYKVGEEARDVPPIKIEGAPDYNFSDVVIENYPEVSDKEESEDEEDLNGTDRDGDDDIFQVASSDEESADEDYDDTAEFSEVGPPTVHQLAKVEVVEEFPKESEIVGKLLLFKLDAVNMGREPGWYTGRVERVVSARLEIMQGYNYVLKFTRHSTRNDPTVFGGTMAVLLDKNSYGLNKQWVLLSAK